MRPLLLILFVLPQLVLTTAAPRAGTACAGAGADLEVMTLNLQFTRVWGQGGELETLAKHVAGRKIDVLLLQEVSGGLLTATSSTADRLRQILADRYSLVYELVYAPASGVRGLFTVGNAILSRCPIVNRRVVELSQVAELRVAGAKWRIHRNLLGVEIATHRGPVAVYTTHLCADCSAEQRAGQLEEALAFITAREAGRDRPLIFGGDLNLDLFRSAGEHRLYWRIRGAGFRDAAALDRPADSLCAVATHPDADCTVGVADPWRARSRRIDYLFTRGPINVVGHRVAFNPRIDPGMKAVSNHAAVAAQPRLVGGDARIAQAAVEPAGALARADAARQ